MVTAALALAILLPGAQRPTPSALVSKMLARYYSVNSLSGKLSYTQTAPDTDGKLYEAHGETSLQIEKPSKLYVYQTSDVKGTTPGRIVSNGQRFVYCIPQDTRDVTRTLGTTSQQAAELVENVKQFDYTNYADTTVGLADMYRIGAPGLPLHPAVPLDIAINDRVLLKAFVDQLATVDDQGEATINGQHAFLIGGDWRQYVDAPVSGAYQLAISDRGDLLRYILREKVSDAGLDPNGSIVRTPVIEVTTTWNVDLKVNGPVDEKLFNDRALTPPQAKTGSPQPGSSKPPRS